MGKKRIQKKTTKGDIIVKKDEVPSKEQQLKNESQLKPEPQVKSEPQVKDGDLTIEQREETIEQIEMDNMKTQAEIKEIQGTIDFVLEKDGDKKKSTGFVGYNDKGKEVDIRHCIQNGLDAGKSFAQMAKDLGMNRISIVPPVDTWQTWMKQLEISKKMEDKDKNTKYAMWTWLFETTRYAK